MSQNMFEHLHRENAELVKLSEEHPDVARLLMKLTRCLMSISQEASKPLEDYHFELRYNIANRKIIIDVLTR